MNNLQKLILMFALSAFPLMANANSIGMTANPSSWRLQNYIPGGVAVYYTGSPCTSGSLELNSTSQTDDKNRFYATVMAAKLSNRSMYVYYDSTNAPYHCIINSFGIDQNQ